MNFLTMQQELADRLSAFDETITSDSTRLKRWLNIAQQEIASSWDWNFLKKFDIIKTVGDVTDGTVSVSSGSTSATLTSAPTDSMTGRFIKFSSADDWYEITAHTAATTGLTIDPGYIQSSDLTNGNFTIRKFFYSMDTTIHSINSVKIAEARRPRLVSLNSFEGSFFVQMLDETDVPNSFVLSTPTSSGTPQIGFYPTPDGPYLIYITGKQETTNLSSDSDVSIIPVPYHHLILDLASFYGFTKLDDTRAKLAFDKYEISLEKMKALFSQNKSQTRVMSATDQSDMSGINEVNNSVRPNLGGFSYDDGGVYS